MGSGRAAAIWCAISAGVRQPVSTARSAARIIYARDARYSARRPVTTDLTEQAVALARRAEEGLGQ